jgi:hypothetical protein
MWYFLTNSQADTQHRWYISEQQAKEAGCKYVSRVYSLTWYLLCFKVYPVKVDAMK